MMLNSVFDRLTKLNIIFFVLAVTWMAVIYMFSCQDGVESDETSMNVVTEIITNNISEYESWSKTKQQDFTDVMDFIVRKLAHFSEYAILGILCYIALSGVIFADKRFVFGLVIILICAAYASCDEIHQLFVSGRSGQIRDVIIDTSGSLFGTLICNLIFKFKTHMAVMSEN